MKKACRRYSVDTGLLCLFGGDDGGRTRDLEIENEAPRAKARDFLERNTEPRLQSGRMYKDFRKKIVSRCV